MSINLFKYFILKNISGPKPYDQTKVMDLFLNIFEHFIYSLEGILIIL